ncbi:MAG: hypothetical protein CVV50_06020 [Spirochaetae bacterium HGW-Spirochaetae-6]|nr:MAG: hypothetical protein CVV50_06020 [Spirochaetae bacterium HGW-Spirochaetae-6]
MRGTGDALLLAESWVGNSPILVAYPDDIVFAEESLSLQMRKKYEAYGKAVLATMEIAGDVSRYGVVAPSGKLDEQTVMVKGMIEKPAPGQEPSKMVSIGRYLFESDIFTKLKQRREIYQGGEFFLTDGIEELIKEEKVVAYNFEGQRLDTGKPEGYLEATLEYAWRFPEYQEIIRRFAGEKIK